jgi:hypothetical protein
LISFKILRLILRVPHVKHEDNSPAIWTSAVMQP